MEGPCPCPHSPGKIESCPLYHCKHIILKYIHTYILFENTFTVITRPQFFLFSTSWLNLVHHCDYTTILVSYLEVVSFNIQP